MLKNHRKKLDKIMEHSAEYGDFLRDRIGKRSYWLLSFILLIVAVMIGSFYIFGHNLIFKKKD